MDASGGRVVSGMSPFRPMPDFSLPSWGSWVCWEDMLERWLFLAGYYRGLSPSLIILLHPFGIVPAR